MSRRNPRIPRIPIDEEYMLDQLEFEFSREELLERMKTNRDTHALAYKQALVGYFLEVAEQAKDIASKARKLSKEAEEAAKADDAPDHTRHMWSVDATRPEDHTADYDRVIDMFELAKTELITLNEQQFAQYVRDEWEWKTRVLTANAFYGGKFGRQIEAATGSSLVL